MTQNNEIITYLKRFSDTTFPVAKQRELALFQRNLEAMFGTTADLMPLGATFNGTPPLGNLLFWEAAGTQHCGVAVLKNGFRVYSITQQKGLAEIPLGARTFDIRALLEESIYTNNEANTSIEEDIDCITYEDTIDHVDDFYANVIAFADSF